MAPSPRVVVFHGTDTGNYVEAFAIVGNGSDLANVRGRFGASIAIDPTRTATGRAIFIGEAGPTQRSVVAGIEAVVAGLVWWLTPDCDGLEAACVASFKGLGRTGESLAALRVDEGTAAFAGMPGRDGGGAGDGVHFALVPDGGCVAARAGSCVDDDGCDAADFCGSGDVCVRDGCVGDLLRATYFILPANAGILDDSGPALGSGVAARIADVDGDGLDDLAVQVTGNAGADGPLGVAVFTHDTLFAAGVTPAPFLTWAPPGGSTNFGAAIVNAGDLDGDGRDEVAIGSDDGVYLARSSDYATLRAIPRPTTAPDDVDADARFGAALAPFVAGPNRGLAIGAPEDDGGAGVVVWLFASDIPVDDIVPDCVTRGAPGARLGSALRGLGPAPGGALGVARTAVGAPGINSVLTLDVAAGCAVTEGPALTGGVAGDRFGAVLGQ